MQRMIKEIGMIRQFSVDIKTDENMSETDLEYAINEALVLSEFKVMGVNWRATWVNDKTYEKGFGPDSSD